MGRRIRALIYEETNNGLGNNDSADDVKNVDLTKIHYLSGPFEVETAEPGDVLLVEIMVSIQTSTNKPPSDTDIAQDVQPHQNSPWLATLIHHCVIETLTNNLIGALLVCYPSMKSISIRL